MSLPAELLVAQDRLLAWKEPVPDLDEILAELAAIDEDSPVAAMIKMLDQKLATLSIDASASNRF